jgi:archaellum component FlaF (FlaF/FlaG flagellin family)
MAIKINTTDKNTYNGKKDGQWTEPKTGKYLLEEAETFEHKSHIKIDSFQVGVTTCVYDEYESEMQINAPLKSDVLKDFEVLVDYTAINDNTPEYVYLMNLPAGTVVTEHGNEYRFEMSHEVEIILIGEMGKVRIKDNSYD